MVLSFWTTEQAGPNPLTLLLDVVKIGQLQVDDNDRPL